MKRTDFSRETKANRQKPKAAKLKRNANKQGKYQDLHKLQRNELITGAVYDSGVAMVTAKQIVKNAAPRNPQGTHISQWKYPYFHPLYCT